MMSFSEYLEEKKIMTAALAGVIAGVPLGLSGKSAPAPQTKQTITTTKTAEIPEPQKVEPEAPQPKTPQIEDFHQSLKRKHSEEYDTIMDAAVNNGISRDDHENLSILFAIRKAENGGPGVEFGVLHPKAKGTNLRTQAGWAAATIMKNRGRHNTKEHGNFINFLGSRYAPKGAENDPKGLNANWIKNVSVHHAENMNMLNK